MKFTGDSGEHFFRSTLVQTIFYGVFSAWVLWHRERPDRTDSFDWRMAEWSLHVPFIRALYDEITTPSKLGPLGLVEVLDWTAAALGRVHRDAFFEKFQDEHAVQYFYEPFLQAFDPELRKQLGVWYTPPEIVQYQVARVDRVLREELNVADVQRNRQPHTIGCGVEGHGGRSARTGRTQHCHVSTQSRNVRYLAKVGMSAFFGAKCSGS